MGRSVVFANSQPDCAGVAWNLKRALEQQTGWDVRSVAGGRNYLDYPQDLLFGEDDEEIRALKPDLWVLQNGLVDVCAQLGFEPENAIVLHHGNDIRYGTRPNYDKNHRMFSRERGWPVYVTTLDLEWLVPDTTWLPPAIDIEFLSQFRDPQGRFVVAHAPTSRQQKGTRTILDGVHLARERGLDFDFDLIEGVSNKECLVRKGRASVFIDQVRWGYGVNALEAMAMGMPVVTGFINSEIADYTRDRLGMEPYLRADTAPDIATMLYRLFSSPGLSGGVSDYLSRYHSYLAVGRNLEAICSSRF